MKRCSSSQTSSGRRRGVTITVTRHRHCQNRQTYANEPPCWVRAKLTLRAAAVTHALSAASGELRTVTAVTAPAGETWKRRRGRRCGHLRFASSALDQRLIPARSSSGFRSSLLPATCRAYAAISCRWRARRHWSRPARTSSCANRWPADEPLALQTEARCRAPPAAAGEGASWQMAGSRHASLSRRRRRPNRWVGRRVASRAARRAAWGLFETR